jgi:serine O-acetyltransferase
VFRLGQYAHRKPAWTPAGLRWRFLRFWWLSVVIGCDLPPWTVVGPGLVLEHAGRGVMVNGRAVLGSNVTLYPRVTIGTAQAGKTAPVPVIGDGVTIGVGASVLGGVTVGDGARIGAGAVVISDIPAGATAVGVPARVVESAPMLRLAEDHV